MSWQAYVNDNLLGNKICSKGDLTGLHGNTCATSAGFTVTPAEGAALAALFNPPANAFGTGVTVGGTKYLTLKADNRSIYGKKGTAGVCTVKTSQCIIIGVYGDGAQPGAAANTVEKLADYLIENGY